MPPNKILAIKYKRRRQGRTNYKRRLKLLLSKKPRIIIRRNHGSIVAQVATFEPQGDKVAVNVSSKNLETFGWKHHAGNLPSAYLTGLLLGKKAQAAGIKEGIVDSGLINSIKGNSFYATLKGIIDSGLKVPADQSIFPNDERISGKHIEDYAKKLKENEEAFKKQYSGKTNPEQITQDFEKTKNAIMGDKK